MLQKARRKLMDERAQHFHKEPMQTCHRKISLARVASRVDYFSVPAEPRVAFFSAKSEASVG